MRLSSDPTGLELARRLARLRYAVTRKTCSHMRLTCRNGGEHHITVPNHDPPRIGTSAAILDAVAAHQDVGRNELLKRLSR